VNRPAAGVRNLPGKLKALDIARRVLRLSVESSTSAEARIRVRSTNLLLEAIEDDLEHHDRDLRAQAAAPRFVLERTEESTPLLYKVQLKRP
jgi:hypothetical protein